MFLKAAETGCTMFREWQHCTEGPSLRACHSAEEISPPSTSTTKSTACKRRASTLHETSCAFCDQPLGPCTVQSPCRILACKSLTLTMLDNEAIPNIPRACCYSCQHHGVHRNPSQAAQHHELPVPGRLAHAGHSTEIPQPAASESRSDQ